MIGKQRFELPGRWPSDKVVNIPRGGIRDTADLLEREGVIDQPYLFIAGALLLKARDELKYGEYQFPKQRQPARRGRHHHRRQGGAARLHHRRGPDLRADRAAAAGERRAHRQHPEIPREGTLLPETYHFTRGITREQMIQRMQQAQQRVVQEVWERRMPDLPIKTPEQLVMLASIIEKETGKPEERTRVAAVFVNRLQAEDEAAIRSDHHLRAGRRQGLARPADPCAARSSSRRPTTPM